MGEEAAGEDDVELANSHASTFVSYVYESMKWKKETNLYSRNVALKPTRRYGRSRRT